MTAAWRAANKADINWITLGEVGPIHDRMQRELALGETSLDLVHVLNGFANPRFLAQLEPLDPHQQAAPIEDLADISSGLIAPLKLDGGLRAIPMRHTTNALIYNEAMFASAALPGRPRPSRN